MEKTLTCDAAFEAIVAELDLRVTAKVKPYEDPVPGTEREVDEPVEADEPKESPAEKSE